MAVVTKTLKSSGGDYSLMSTWESTEQTDLVSAGDSHVLECYSDWPSGLDDTCQVSGWTTSATNDVTIRAAAGHEHAGVRGAGFKIVNTTATTTSTIHLVSQNVTLDGIEVAGVGSGYALLFQSGASNVHTVQNCIIAADSGYSATEICYAKVTGVKLFYNTLIEGGGRGCDARGTSSGTKFYNCTIAISTSYGLLLDSNCEVKNCVSVATTNAFFGTPGTASNNASDDTTAPGAGSVTGIVTTTGTDFTDYSGGDYSVSGTGSALYDAGTDLSGTFTDDITGATRSQWDIGAYEYISVGGATNPKGPLGHPLHGPFGGPV